MGLQNQGGCGDDGVGMGQVSEDWSTSPDLCSPLSLDQDRLDCELALLAYRTTEELQDNLVLCYIRMPEGGYTPEQKPLVTKWREALITELNTRKPTHWRHCLEARLTRESVTGQSSKSGA
jgi:hypothetical protein